MLHVSSIALLTVSLNLATRVPLFTNLRLRFVGAGNHNRDHLERARHFDAVVKCFQNEVFSHGNFCLCIPFMVPQERFSHPTYAFNDGSEDSLHVQGWVSFASIAQGSLGKYPHGRGEV